MSGYTPNIPQANDRPSGSQAQILNNFTALENIYGIDHYPFTDASINQGKHQKVTLPAQTSDPNTGANELAIFSKYVGGDLRLFVREQSNSQSVPLFSSVSSTVSAPDFVISLDGVIIQGVRYTTPNPFVSGLAMITYPTAFTNCFGVVFANGPSASSAAFRLDNFGNTSCQIFLPPGTGPNQNIYVVAFGN
jgi:hypothetical protein